VAAYSPAPATLQLQAIAPNQPYVPQQQASPLPQMQVVQIPPTRQLQMQMQPPGSHQSSQQLLAQQQVATVPVVQTIQQHQQQLQLQQLKQQQMQLKPPSLPSHVLASGTGGSNSFHLNPLLPCIRTYSCHLFESDNQSQSLPSKDPSRRYHKTSKSPT